MATPNLPGPVQELWHVWREIEGKAAQPMTLGLVAARGPEREHWRDALLIGSQHPARLVEVPVDTEAPALTDAYLVLVHSTTGALAKEMPVLARLDRERLVVALVGIPEAQAAVRQRDVMHALMLEPEQVVLLSTISDLAADGARALFDRLPELMIPLARQFPIFRTAAAWQEIQDTAKQNAMIGALPLPGADMPIMTGNQIKMILRMAAFFDMPMSWDRGRELLAVVGGGLALRTAARQVVKFIPGPGWLLAGGIGYTGTVAMGKAALEYFRMSAPSHQLPVVIEPVTELQG